MGRPRRPRPLIAGRGCGVDAIQACRQGWQVLGDRASHDLARKKNIPAFQVSPPGEERFGDAQAGLFHEPDCWFALRRSVRRVRCSRNRCPGGSARYRPWSAPESRHVDGSCEDGAERALVCDEMVGRQNGDDGVGISRAIDALPTRCTEPCCGPQARREVRAWNTRKASAVAATRSALVATQTSSGHTTPTDGARSPRSGFVRPAGQRQ